MDTEKISRSRIGQFFIRVMAWIMECRWRYRFFGPDKLLQAAGLGQGMHVLEVGCGTGYFTVPAGRMLGEQGTLVAIDLLSISVEAVRKRIEEAGLKNVRVFQRDVLETTLENESLDEIFLFGVIPAPMLPMEKLLAEMFRILRKDGILAVWPPSWVHRTIARSPWFVYVGRQSGVYTYRRFNGQN